MILKKWDDLPEFMKCDEVKVYYDILSRKKGSLILKRIFDIVVGVILLILLSIPMLIIAVMIKMDSKGPVFYRQERVTRYGKKFRIHKFRTMVNNADKIGSSVTVGGDLRITRVGSRIRDYRLDELPQVFDVLKGNMSFVGTRPEATKYVEKYSNEKVTELVFHKVWHISQFIYIFGRYWNLQFLLAFHRHILNMNFIYSGPGKHFLYIMKMRC